MKALTLTQPWASLIAVGAKRVETRSWQPRALTPGDRIAIHAAVNLAPVGGKRGLRAVCSDWPFHDALRAHGGWEVAYRTRGVIVATAAVIGYRRSDDCDDLVGFGWVEEWFGDYSPGRWAWLLEDVRALPEPVACRGGMGLWDVPAEVGWALFVAGAA